MSRPVGSKNLAKKVEKKSTPKKKVVAPKKSPVVVEEVVVKRKRRTKAEIAASKQEVVKVEVVQEEVPVVDESMTVRFLDLQFFEKVTPDVVALSVKKQGVEISITANTEEKYVEILVVAVNKEGMTKKIRPVQTKLKFEEFLTFISMMKDYETSNDIKERRLAGKF